MTSETQFSGMYAQNGAAAAAISIVSKYIPHISTVSNPMSTPEMKASDQ
jgi:hypothetical protein